MQGCHIVKLVTVLFLATIKAVAASKQGCDADLSGNNGTLLSPNYPRNYSTNTICTWQITVPSSMVINFEFEDFDVESGDNGKCDFDKLVIQEKKEKKFKTSATFCGSSIPKPFTTSSNLARVIFSSDESENRRGFELKWLATFPLSSCGLTFYNSSFGSLQSPSYPASYPNNLNCSYTLIIPRGHRMILTIHQIDIEYESTCQYDAFEIHDQTRMLGRYCGNKEPTANIIAYGPHVLIRFLSDDSTAGKGFNITWKSEKVQDQNDNRKCGRKYHTSRIVGGVFASRGEFPWQAAFFWRTGIAKGKFFCGGALVSDGWILTAAHCFVNGRNSTLYKVVLGEKNIAIVEEHEQEFNITKIVVHEDYDMITHDNDIALVKLSTNPSLDDYVNTICLPSRAVNAGIRCQIAGWGATVEHGRASSALMKADVPVVNSSVCSREDVYGSKITRNMMCAGYAAGGVDTCQGDSGGPLVCRDPDDPLRWELQGIASWGRGCGRQLRYGVYTIAVNYLDWIKELIGETRYVNSTNATLSSIQAAMTGFSRTTLTVLSNSKLSDFTSFVSSSRYFGEINASVKLFTSQKTLKLSNVSAPRDLASLRTSSSSTIYKAVSNDFHKTYRTLSSISEQIMTQCASMTSFHGATGTINQVVSINSRTLSGGTTAQVSTQVVTTKSIEKSVNSVLHKTSSTNAKTVLVAATPKTLMKSSHQTLYSEYHTESFTVKLKRSLAIESSTQIGSNTAHAASASSDLLYSSSTSSITQNAAKSNATTLSNGIAATSGMPVSTTTLSSENAKSTAFENKTSRTIKAKNSHTFATSHGISTVAGEATQSKALKMIYTSSMQEQFTTVSTTNLTESRSRTAPNTSANLVLSSRLLPANVSLNSTKTTSLLTNSPSNYSLVSSRVNLAWKSSLYILSSKTQSYPRSRSNKNNIDTAILFLLLGMHFIFALLMVRP